MDGLTFVLNAENAGVAVDARSGHFAGAGGKIA